MQFFALNVSASDSTGIAFVTHQERLSDSEVLLSFKAIIALGIKLFGLQKAESDHLYSSLSFDSAVLKYIASTPQVWSDSEVMKRLKEDFVIVSLYVDVQYIDLPEGEQYCSKGLGKQVETLWDKNADLQVTRIGANT